jgi:CheY-like chemotaxis protein
MSASTQAEWRQRESPGETESPALRVVVAEDAADVRRMVAVALRRLGYSVVEAASGPELLDKLGDALLSGVAASRPHVIISDIRMPGLTGLEVLAGIRQAGWPTRVVLMTAYADPDTRAEARRLGVDALFAKPFDIDDLMTVVVNMTSPEFEADRSTMGAPPALRPPSSPPPSPRSTMGAPPAPRPPSAPPPSPRADRGSRDHEIESGKGERSVRRHMH